MDTISQPNDIAAAFIVGFLSAFAFFGLFTVAVGMTNLFGLAVLLVASAAAGTIFAVAERSSQRDDQRNASAN